VSVIDKNQPMLTALVIMRQYRPEHRWENQPIERPLADQRRYL
jgi:uncharacterized Fe-S radical SAM superfamily protein PflX